MKEQWMCQYCGFDFAAEPAAIIECPHCGEEVGALNMEAE